MANVLFVHNNFPGQFGFIAEALVARGDRCVAIGSETARGVPGVDTIRWTVPKDVKLSGNALSARAEIDLVRGRLAAACAIRLKEQGFQPDLIVGHPGWGETLFLKEIFPNARSIAYAEFYYRTHGADVNFDPEFPPLGVADGLRVHAKNMGLTLAYLEADLVVAPTPFQASLLPPRLRDARIVHEGVETGALTPNRGVALTIADQRIDGKTPVVTFINRTFEPLRGFHVFARALPKLMREVPDVKVVCIGNEARSGYGASAPEGKTWREVFMREIEGRYDPQRVFFTGRVPHETMLAALSLSWAHVYYTYPFVLSWSLLEAMAMECLVVASDTAPVRDIVVDGRNGLLRPFFDPEALADTLIAACREPERYRPLREAARKTVVEGYDRRTVCLPQWTALVDEMLARPAP